MQDTFRGYYLADIEELMKRKDTIFVFDTNVLLNLYSYTEQTREDFFSLLNSISERVWIPYHVGLEYHRNRLTVIKNEKKIFNELSTYTKNIKKSLNTSLLQNLKLKQRLPKLHEETNELDNKITELLDKYSDSIKKWDNKQPCVRSKDLIRDTINNIFDKKIGDIPESQEYLNKLFEEGEERYKSKIPPGYEDEKGKKNDDPFRYSGLEYIPMYGDYIIWDQLINEVNLKNIKSLLFITDDVKEDWLYLMDSNGKKEIGPRIELVDEIFRKTEIELFHIGKSSDFLSNGKEHLNNKIKEDSIEEINDNFDTKQNDYTTKINEEMIKYSINLKDKDISDEYIKLLKKFKIFDKNETEKYKIIVDNMFKKDFDTYEKYKQYEMVNKYLYKDSEKDETED